MDISKLQTNILRNKLQYDINLQSSNNFSLIKNIEKQYELYRFKYKCSYKNKKKKKKQLQSVGLVHV